MPRKWQKSLFLLVLFTLSCVVLYNTIHNGLKSTVSQAVIPNHRKIPLLEQGLYRPAAQQTCERICDQISEVSTIQERSLVQVGPVEIQQELERDPKAVFVHNFLTLLPGGAWAFRRHEHNSTGECKRAYREGVAVLIVCKNRWRQVNILLHYLIPLMQKQRLCFRVFVIEQRNPDELNKAMLFNVAFLEASERFRFGCVIFHDADLAPINDLNPYGCDSLTKTTVVHLGVALDDRSNVLRYRRLVGGVLKMTSRAFIRVNGFSNMYWGWGQEDDDMEKRIRARGLHYTHMVNEIARYHVIKHGKAKRDRVKEHRSLLKKAATRMTTDGLNSVKYVLVAAKEEALYTHFLVDLSRT